MLADLGAEVIKIEPPSGELGRRLGSRRGGMSGYYMQQNAGKTNVSIDTSCQRGRELAANLVAKCDVLVENFRPGVMDSMGLGAKTLMAVTPSLIYCSISGFGHDSPLRHRRAFAGIAHATTGMLHRQAVLQGGEPTDSVLAAGDTVTGLQAAIAILSALHLRSSTGQGQFIDMAMHDALLSIQEAANFHLFGDDFSETDFLCSWVYRCGDEHVAIASDPRASWTEFCALMERPELVESHRFDTYEKRAARLDELEAIIQGWVAGIDGGDEVVRRLHEAGMPGARILTLGEALESEQTRARGMVVPINDRNGGETPVLNSPYRFSAAAAGLHGKPAFRGEDNAQVLARVLGLSDGEVAELEAEGVVSSRIPEGAARGPED